MCFLFVAFVIGSWRRSSSVLWCRSVSLLTQNWAASQLLSIVFMLQILAQKVRPVLKYREEQRGEQTGRLLRVAEIKTPGHRTRYGFGAAHLQLCSPWERVPTNEIVIYCNIVMRTSATTSNLPPKREGVGGGAGSLEACLPLKTGIKSWESEHLRWEDPSRWPADRKSS